MRKSLVILSLVGLLAGAGAAVAQAPAPAAAAVSPAAVSPAALSPADAVKARQANLKQLGAAAKVLNDQTKAPTPDIAAIKDAAAKVRTLSAALPTWFPAGSGKSAGVKTAAKDEIWTDAAGFATAARTLADAGAKLDQIAQTGDVAAVKTQFQAVGMPCGGCHKTYREREQ
jgi:cytochrome c556